MIKSIEDLKFDKKMSEFIYRAEETFNAFTEVEDNKTSMLDWINENLEALLEDKVMKNLTEREQFLFALGILSSELENMLND